MDGVHGFGIEDVTMADLGCDFFSAGAHKWAGITTFEVAGMDPKAVVKRLLEKRIVATVTPYQASYARVAPGLLNSSADVDAALREIRALG